MLISIFQLVKIGNLVWFLFPSFISDTTNLYSIFSSDELSWRRATELLVEVARQGEETGFVVPCLLVAAKCELDPFPMSVQESARVIILYFLLFLSLYISTGYGSLLHIFKSTNHLLFHGEQTLILFSFSPNFQLICPRFVWRWEWSHLFLSV